MKKTMKLLAAALAGTLVLGGCAGNKETTAASAESETVKETEAQSTELKAHRQKLKLKRKKLRLLTQPVQVLRSALAL